MIDFHKKYQSFTQASDKCDVFIEDGRKLLSEVDKSVTDVKAKLNVLQINSDENLAKRMAEKEDDSNAKRITVLEKAVAEHAVKIDDGEQYGRRETVEFHNIPCESVPGRRENCYNIVINFLRYHYNLHLNKRDISVCHRQIIPSEKRRLGRSYIPPIYCKFLNRYFAQEILDRRSCLKGHKNTFGQPIFVSENLTFAKRVLWDSVNAKLDSYKHKYINNWKIFAKKDHGNRPVHVTSDQVLDKLVSDAASTPTPVNPVQENPPPIENPPPESAPQSTQEHSETMITQQPSTSEGLANQGYNANWGRNRYPARYYQSHNSYENRPNVGMAGRRLRNVHFNNYRSPAF